MHSDRKMEAQVGYAGTPDPRKMIAKPREERILLTQGLRSPNVIRGLGVHNETYVCREGEGRCGVGVSSGSPARVHGARRMVTHREDPSLQPTESGDVRDMGGLRARSCRVKDAVVSVNAESGEVRACESVQGVGCGNAAKVLLRRINGAPRCPISSSSEKVRHRYARPVG